MALRRLLLALLLLALAGASAKAGTAPASPPERQASVLILNDIHFDPFDDGLARRLAAAPVADWESLLEHGASRLPSRVGKDTDWALWHSTLDALGRTHPRYAYVVLLGDYQSHHFDTDFKKYVGGDAAAYRAFALKTLFYLQGTLQARLPGTPEYWVLGNNDSDSGDYEMPVGGPFLAALAHDWGVDKFGPDAERSFRAGGYYEARLPGKAGRLIALNDTLWSKNRRDPDEAPAYAELAWLKARLDADARAGRRVTLAMHIPPGFDTHSSLDKGRPVPFLKPEFEGPFLALLRAHAAILRPALAAHTHDDDFRALEGPQGPVAMHLGLSVSPVHGNRPGFAVERLRADGGSFDLDTYVLSNLDAASRGAQAPRWGLEYGFRRAYGRDFDVAGIAALTKALASGGPADRLFTLYYAGGSGLPASPAGGTEAAYAGATRCFDARAFQSCLDAGAK